MEILTTLYAHDPFRFFIWDLAHLLGIAETIITLLHLAGVELYEDYTAVKGN